MHPRLLLPLFIVTLAGCDQLGLDDSARAIAVREAEGKAIGGACRHSGRALEDCYAINTKSSKAAIFAGWRDMDAYMRENSIQVVIPQLVEPPVSSSQAGPPPAKAAEGSPAEGADKTAVGPKTGVKHSTAPEPARPGKIT